jgi:DNA-binding MarR family transcriptional regulator
MDELYEQRLGFLVSDVARLYGVRFDQRARRVLNLTRAQCRVLVYLQRYGAMNQAQLAELLDVTPMTIARMLDRMQAGGWIDRLADARDRRAFQLRLTAQAEAAIVDVLLVGNEITAEAAAGLSADETATLTALLRKVRNNLATVAG